MAGNPNLAGSNFGQSYLKTGKFGKPGKEAIKSAGFTVQDFLKQANVNQNNAMLAKNPQSFKQTFQQTLNAGNPNVKPPNQDPVQPQNPNPEPTQQPQGPGVAEGLLNQSTDLTNVGANILNNGNPASNPLLNAGNNFQTGAQQDFGKVDFLAQQARNQGQTILNANARQQAEADQDIQNLFNAQPLDTLRSNLAQLNSAAQASGRSNSRSGNEINAEIQRGLIRDQAAARLGSNNQFRGQEFQELDRQRTTDLALGNQFSGQALGQGNLGNQALSLGGNLINDTNTVGANIFNQGFQNQLGSLGFINNAAQQSFNSQNQLLQKALANRIGAKQNRQTKALQDAMLALQQQQAEGGGFLSGAIGGLAGGLGGLLG
jgi:hypothetical protein